MRFSLDLSDVDSGVYDQLEIRAAQHPSESDAYLVTRVLAMALEYREGLVFGRGISTPDEPGLYVDDPRGDKELWIEIGAPSATKLHKVTKLASEVLVYTHKNPEPILVDLRSGTVHRGEEVRVIALSPEFVGEVAGTLQRKNEWSVLRSDGELYVTVGDATFQTTPVVLAASG